ncbi:MAG: PD-(D/E)XK nuclease family transposase [Pyramidobacter sp.]|nr:PD-(D/E)XK nuclease family transposase [Pyramidobacter sp.]
MISRQELIEKLLRMTLKDDTLFTAVCKRFPDVAQFILRIILDKPDLLVTEVNVQDDERSTLNRSVRLDVVAVDSRGKVYNIEVQQSNEGAAPERARFHSAVLDSGRLKKSQPFTDLPETYVIFITRDDVLHTGLKLVHVERTITELNRPFGDREHIVYACMKYADKTPLGWLLHDFLCREAGEMHYPELAEKVQYFKENEKGVGDMCEIMQELNRRAVFEANRKNVQRMLKQGFDRKTIMKALDLTEEEYEELATPLAG